MTTFRAHLISAVLAETESFSIFELPQNALTEVCSELSESEATLSLFLALFYVSVSHFYYLALHDFLKLFPHTFNTFTFTTLLTSCYIH